MVGDSSDAATGETQFQLVPSAGPEFRLPLGQGAREGLESPVAIRAEAQPVAFGRVGALR